MHILRETNSNGALKFIVSINEAHCSEFPQMDPFSRDMGNLISSMLYLVRKDASSIDFHFSILYGIKNKQKRLQNVTGEAKIFSLFR